MGDVKIAVRAYERFSVIGSSRVSLTLTFVSDGDFVHLTAISSGGSQAVFFKINTWGESSFLENLTDEIKKKYTFE